MTTFDVGVVFGKFWPLHMGHTALLRRATESTRDLQVFVDDGPEDVPVAERMAWVQDLIPRATVMPSPDLCGHESEYCTPECSRRYTAFVRAAGVEPDAVFAADPYGAVLAKELGATIIQIDKEHECKGREIRADIPRYWSKLSEPARPYYCARVVVVGAESTGTTTLASDLAASLATVSVPEYGRAFTEARGLDHPWSTRDFVHIAERQTADIDEASRGNRPIIVADTDALATAIWHERYLGTRAPDSIWEQGSRRPPRIYILTGPEIPFVQDGWRDGEHLRGWMTERFREELDRSGIPWLEVSGDRDQRLASALTAITRTIGTHWIGAGGAQHRSTSV